MNEQQLTYSAVFRQGTLSYKGVAHWHGCWRYHLGCAIAEIERLQKQAKEQEVKQAEEEPVITYMIGIVKGHEDVEDTFLASLTEQLKEFVKQEEKQVEQ